jgi:Pin2-interacting protein X1
MELLGSDPNNVTWANNKSSLGARLMAKMGWAHGQGLGAEAQGKVENIKVVQRTDTTGIGAETVLFKTGEVSAHMDGFDAVLAKLAAAHAPVTVTEKTVRVEKSEVQYGSKRVTYKKVQRAKMVKNYSDQDLANILGKTQLKRSASDLCMPVESDDVDLKPEPEPKREEEEEEERAAKKRRKEEKRAKKEQKKGKKEKKEKKEKKRKE